MSYFPTVQHRYEITAGQHQLKEGDGFVDKLIIHLKGSDKSKVWRVWDSIGATDQAVGKIIWAAFSDDPKVQPGSIIELGWTFSEGLFLEVPPDGVCSIAWI